MSRRIFIDQDPFILMKGVMRKIEFIQETFQQVDTP
jgi:hypothetical protein